jgi:hypothetical protein
VQRRVTDEARRLLLLQQEQEDLEEEEALVAGVADEVHYEFSSDDGAGADYNDPTKKKRTAPGQPRQQCAGGPGKKIRTNVVVDPRGEELKTKDGAIKINLAKFLMRHLTAAMLETPTYKGLADHKGRLLTTNHYECRLHDHNGHKHRFFQVNANTGNLMKHCRSAHAEMLTAIERLVAEVPSSDAPREIVKFVANVKAPSGSIRAFFNRQVVDDKQLCDEALIFMFWLDANLPFDQLDNEYFREHLRSNHLTMAKSETLVATYLPLLFNFAKEKMREVLSMAKSYWTTFDGWSRHNEKFLSQSYHLIVPQTFDYKVMLLDMIPFEGQQFAQVVAGALRMRQNDWTAGFNLLVAGGVADGESKMQAAGKAMYGDDDMHHCANHSLKLCYEDGEKVSGQYKLDFDALVSLSSYAAVNGNVSTFLAAFQKLHDLAELKTLLYCPTRWEGRFILVRRAAIIKDPLIALGNSGMPLITELREKVPDFLRVTFFERLEAYLGVLQKLNDVSLFYQTQAFPTGCFVPLCTLYMLAVTKSDVLMEQPFLVAMKDAFHAAIVSRVKQCVLDVPNNFLKAGLLHPGVAGILKSTVKDDVLDACFNSILEDAKLLVPEAMQVYTAPIVSSALQY